ncbi:MAG: winged helix-turn-helix domain-containing protein [Candidatus Hermodarchaeota archaeon]
MSNHEESAARSTLRMAGVLQEVRDVWIRRLESYFAEVERLIDGEWLDASDLVGLVRETRLASKEAVDGLANDLSAELLHASSGAFARYEAERIVLSEEIEKQKAKVARILATDEDSIRRENESLRSAMAKVPEYKLLRIIQTLRGSTYDQLAEKSGLGKGMVRKHLKSLMAQGYVNVNKKARPHKILFLNAPWDLHSPAAAAQLPLQSAQPLHPQV